MWGIRAIRVGVLVVLLASVGCKSAEPPPWGTWDWKSGPPGAKTETESEPQLLPGERRPWLKNDQPNHLTPERVTGGIY